jgi:hypothetical protein
MNNSQRKILSAPMQTITAIHAPEGSTRRKEAERFIQQIFGSHYNAQVNSFTPNLMMLEKDHQLIAATGWRSAQAEPLFLERYLDVPIEQAMFQLANPPVKREKIVEVGHLASQKAGGSVQIIRALASHLNDLGFEWVVFTATQELIRIFTKLRLPLLALATADPERLRNEAQNWGTYYDTQPIVVAGKIKIALQRMGNSD